MSSVYEFIDGERCAYPLVLMCKWAGVSRSGYYAWREKPMSATRERREGLKKAIRQIFDDCDQTYGYRRVRAELSRRGGQAGLELVRALMRELDLVPCQPRPWRLTTIPDPDAAHTPDLVRRDFSADAPGQKLVGDITYVKTWEGWLYLATVIDCHTKMVFGYAVGDHMRTSLVADAIDMAVRNHNIPWMPYSIRTAGASMRPLSSGTSFVLCESGRRSVGRGFVGIMRWPNRSTAR